MSDEQIEKLKKILALTTSTNDNEALVVVRKANQMLKDADKTWVDVIGVESAETNNRYLQLSLKHIALANEYNS
jgi:hypothetical protein